MKRTQSHKIEEKDCAQLFSIHMWAIHNDSSSIPPAAHTNNTDTNLFCFCRNEIKVVIFNEFYIYKFL